LEDSFIESSRKCLALFSRRDEVSELQEIIGKKVNWTEYNTVLKKLSDLRLYTETLADEVFIGHREALNREFAKKSNQSWVEEQLRLKTDLTDLNEVRASLERLEVQVAHNDAKQSKHVQELRDETEAKRLAMAKEHLAMISTNRTSIAELRGEHECTVAKLTTAEGEIVLLNRRSQELGEILDTVRKRQEEVVITSIEAIQAHLAAVDTAAQKTQSDLQQLAGEVSEFRETSKQKFSDLYMKMAICKEQLEFLMQAVDAIKKRSRETAKAHTTQFKEITDDQEKMAENLADMERSLKRSEREIRDVDRRTMKALDDGLPPDPLPLPPPDQNERLKGVLEQLELIANGGTCQPVHVDPKRPALPWHGKGGGCSAEADLPRLGRFDAKTPSCIDTARNAGTAHGTHGLGAHVQLSSGKGQRKKRNS